MQISVVDRVYQQQYNLSQQPISVVSFTIMARLTAILRSTDSVDSKDKDFGITPVNTDKISKSKNSNLGLHCSSVSRIFKGLSLRKQIY